METPLASSLPPSCLQAPQTHKPTAHTGLRATPGVGETPCNIPPPTFPSHPWTHLSPATSSWKAWNLSASRFFWFSSRVCFVFVWKTSSRLVTICILPGFPETAVMTGQGSSDYRSFPSMGSFEFEMYFIHHVEKMGPSSQVNRLLRFSALHRLKAFFCSAFQHLPLSLRPWFGSRTGFLPHHLSITFAPSANTDSFVIIPKIGAFKKAANQFILLFSVLFLLVEQ